MDILKRCKQQLDLAKSQIIRMKFFAPKAASFFATLLQELPTFASPSVPTMGTDGMIVVANPEFTDRCTAKQRATVLLHEVVHGAEDHMGRGAAIGTGPTDPDWQAATDLSINDMLVEMGGDLPGDPHLAEKHGFEKFLSAEEYWLLLKKEKEDAPQKTEPLGQQPGTSEPQDAGDTPSDGSSGTPSSGDHAAPPREPTSCGEIFPAGSLSEELGIAKQSKEQIRQKWQMAIAKAEMVAEKTRGEWPAGLKAWIDKRLRPEVPWAQLLMDWRDQLTRDTWIWTRPNRRYVAHGIYLPSLGGKKLPTIAVTNDTSGSIGTKTQQRFFAEIMGICEVNPSELLVMHHHTDVWQTDTWTPMDAPYTMPEDLETGGTSHVDVFKRIAANADIRGVICLTDCYTEYPADAPAVPVIWVVVDNPDAKPPFGQVIHLKSIR